MDLTMITCAYLPSRFVLRELQDPRMKQLTWKEAESRLELVQSVWSYAEYTWIKAKRVLDRWEDPYKSSKNVYFVFRILELGCQLLTHDKIVDFDAANHRYVQIQNLYQTYNIQPGEFAVVEAALARAYEQEISRFQATVSQQQPKLALTKGIDPANAQRKDNCSICFGPCESAQKASDEVEVSSNTCTLLCGHSFHLECTIRWIRHETSSTTCPLCRQELCTKIDRKAAIQRELERRGVPPRQFTGYPATIVIENQNDQNSLPITAP